MLAYTLDFDLEDDLDECQFDLIPSLILLIHFRGSKVKCSAMQSTLY